MLHWIKPLMDSRTGLSDEHGQAIVEYALLVAAIAAACVGVITLFGGVLGGFYNTITTAI